MSRIILFAQQKGGAGKTTLVTQLGVAFMQAGRSVTIVDVDPQRSSAGWFDARVRRLGEAGGLDLIETSEWRAGIDIRKAAKSAEIVLIDVAGNADVLGRVAMREATLAVVPCQPSMADVWASAATLEMARKERLDHVVVMNRMPPRSKVAEACAEEMAKSGAEVLETRVGNRTAYAEAYMKGAGVTELAASSKAAEEIAALAAALDARPRA